MLARPSNRSQRVILVRLIPREGQLAGQIEGQKNGTLCSVPLISAPHLGVLDWDHMPTTVLRDSRSQFELGEFLSRPLIVHVATHSKDGARNSVFWFAWEDGAFWMILEEGYNTVQTRVTEDPRVALGLVDFDPGTGFLQHVSVRGRATLEPWDDDRAARLLDRYYRRLDGYTARPLGTGATTRGRRPMIFLKVIPETILLRELGYRDGVLRKQTKRATGT